MVEIDGEHVRLREFRLADLSDSMAVVGDQRVTRWLSFDALAREDQAERLSGAIERTRQEPRLEYYLAVTTHSTDRLIGFARLALGGVKAGKLGYAIAADHWGNGYATGAARALVNYGFTHLGLHRITAAVGPDNSASIAVLEKLGFVQEGKLRDHVFTNGAWRDSILFSVLVQEWRH